jgi:hypothetical protein
MLALTLEANQLDFEHSAPTFAMSEQTSAANNVRPICILIAVINLLNGLYLLLFLQFSSYAIKVYSFFDRQGQAASFLARFYLA